MGQVIWAFLSGLLFAIGLGVAGMTRPTKVIGFLDLAGDWDPSLQFVMVGAIAVYAAFYRVVLRRSRPLVAAKFQVPPKRTIDRRLLIGAVLFGAGWGLGGYCPGPAIAGALTGSVTTLAFIASMVVGVLLHALFQVVQTRSEKRSTPMPHQNPEGSHAN